MPQLKLKKNLSKEKYICTLNLNLYNCHCNEISQLILMIVHSTREKENFLGKLFYSCLEIFQNIFYVPKDEFLHYFHVTYNIRKILKLFHAFPVI